MGMFSWNCRGCGHPALASRATDVGINEWMTEVVVLTSNGSRVIGEYDGYGRVDGWDRADCGGDPCLWHRACWELAGQPGFDKPSDGAVDQGWFFADGDHDMLDPRVTHEPDTLALHQAERAGRKFGRRYVEYDEDVDRECNGAD